MPRLETYYMKASWRELRFFNLRILIPTIIMVVGVLLASAISANVAKGLLLEDSILISIDFIHRGMISLANKLGFGNSPLNHTVTPAHVASSVIKHPTVCRHFEPVR